MADVRKLMETAQEVLSQPATEFPAAFWEVLAKRSIQSMHLLKPLELAIIARTFDTHGVELKRNLDVYGSIAQQARALSNFPGLAILVLADVLPRRLAASKADLATLLQRLGRQASDVMWELSPQHAIRLLEALTSSGVRDPALCARVARKVALQLETPGSLALEDLDMAASALAGQEHRDLPVLLAIAEAAADQHAAAPSDEASQAAGSVLAALERLGVDEVPGPLRAAAAAAAAAPGEGAGEAAARGADASGVATAAPGAEEASQDAFSLEEDGPIPPRGGGGGGGGGGHRRHGGGPAAR